MAADTTVLLVEAASLPSALEEQLAKRGTFVEHAQAGEIAQVLPVAAPDLIVQSSASDVGATIAFLQTLEDAPPLIVIADRGAVRDLRVKNYPEIKSLIPQDLPVAAVAHRLSTMARRSAEGHPVDQPSQAARPPAQARVPAAPGIAPGPPQLQKADKEEPPPSSKRGSLAPAPLAPRQSVRIIELADQQLEEKKERERRESLRVAAAAERKAEERRQADEKRRAEEEDKRTRAQEERDKRAAEAERRAREAQKRSEERRQEREREQAERMKRLEDARLRRAREQEERRSQRAPAPPETTGEIIEDAQLEDLFPSDPQRRPSARPDFPVLEKTQLQADVHVPETAPVPRTPDPPATAAPAPAPQIPAAPAAVAAPERGKRMPAAFAKTIVGMSPPPTRSGAESVPSEKVASAQATSRKDDELSVIMPLPVELRMELNEATRELPAIRLAMLDTDLTRADILTLALRQRGMKIHPLTPDPGATRWPLLRRFAPQGLVVDEKSMARGASAWVETFRGDPFLRHVPVILVRFSRLLAENGTDVTLDPLIHLIEPLGREEFALLEKLAPGRQVDLWLSQVAPFRLVQMLTQEDRNTRLDCRSKTERMVWHLGPGYAGKAKLVDLGSDRARARLTPEEALSWLLSHEDCQVAVHEHDEPLAHASESKDSELLLHEMTEALGTPERHRSVRPPAGSNPGAESTFESESGIPTLSDSAILVEDRADKGLARAEQGGRAAVSRSAAGAGAAAGTGAAFVPRPSASTTSRAMDKVRSIDVSTWAARTVDLSRRGWTGYRSGVERVVAPLSGKVPDQVLTSAPLALAGLLFLVILLVIWPSSTDQDEDRTALADEKATTAAAPAPPQEPTIAEKPVEKQVEEVEEKPASTDDPWRIAPDAKLPTCEERLGPSAPDAPSAPRAAGYWKQSRRLLMVGKTKEAIDMMCLAGLYDPSGPAAEGLAEYYLGQRSLAQAERWVRESLKADSARRTSAELLSDVQNQKGEVEAARKTLLDTLLLGGAETQKMQMTARKLAQDAELARKGGDLPRAERELRRAALLSPDDARIAIDLGEIFLRRGENQAAITWAQRALKIDPNFSLAMLLAGRAAEAKGDKDEARQFYEMVPLGDPFHKQAQNRRSRL